MPFERNTWYKVESTNSNIVYGRWRDATADGPDVFCYEESLSNELPTNDKIFTYEEFSNSEDAIIRLSSVAKTEV